MEMASLRLRVIFEDPGILSKSQKKDGLKCSWVFLKPHLNTISDVISYLIHSFNLHDSCPNGIILSMDGFVLPPFESTTVLKDKDLICVKRKGTKLQDVTKAIDGAKTSIEDAAVEKQPLPSGILLLTDKGHVEETGGYQSDTDEDEDETKEIVLPLENVSGRDVASKKRKASSRFESLKTKRQRQLTPKSVQKKHANSREHTPQKKSNTLKKKSNTPKKKSNTPKKKSKLEKRNEADPISKPEVSIKCTENLEPTSQSDEPRESTEKTAAVSQMCDVTKKVSRGARRRKLQRMWRKIHRAKDSMDKCEGQPPVKDLQADSGSKKSVATNISECQQVNEESDADGELVPVVIRPGHIRFTSSEKVKDQQNQAANGGDVLPTDNTAWENHSKRNAWNVQENNISKELFQWNGITNKRKGQKWGKQKQPTASWKLSRDDNVSHGLPRQFEWNGTTNKLEGQKWGKEKQSTSSWKNSKDYNAQSSGSALDFEKLVPVIDLPKAGDVIAYRLLELSSTWCPELSSFRIGKVTKFEPESNRIVLVPDPEYPLNIEKKTYEDDDDESGRPPESSMYDEDGTLEIDFPSLVDVRIVKRGDLLQPDGAQAPATNGSTVPSETSKRVDETQVGDKNAASDVGNGELEASTPVNGKKDVWEEISEALSAKKAQLSQEDCWKKKSNSANRSWSNRTLRGSALGPTMAMLRAQNGL